MVKNQVIALNDGFYASVDGHLYGPWACKEYAQAGLETEERRAAKRYIRNVPWTPHNTTHV